VVRPRANEPTVSIPGPARAAAAFRGLPSRIPELRLEVRSIAGLRALSVVRRQVVVLQRLVVELPAYRAPYGGWRGSLGAIPSALSTGVTWPEGESGPLLVDIRLREPAVLADLARAIVPLAVPVATLHRHGSTRVAVASGVSAGVLALLPEPTARRPRPEPRPEVLRGTDVLLVSAAEASATSGEIPEGEVTGAGPGELGAVRPQRARRRRLRDDPSSDPALEPQHVIEVDELGQIVGEDIPHSLDLRVHNPMGWVPEPDEPADARTGEIRLVDGVIQLVRAGGVVVVSAPVRRPLSEAWVRFARRFQRITLASLREPRDAGSRSDLARRLSELAASGPAVFGGTRLHRVLDMLDAELAELLSRKDAPASGLPHTVHAVTQHRAAMRAHAGFFALDRAVQRLGFDSLTPSVTALLVTNRPDRIVPALRGLSQQTYPRFDVVVVGHGVPVPQIPDDLAGIVSDVVELPQSVPFGEALARASTLADGDLLTKVDDDDHYGPEHVWDLVLARMFSGANVVGKPPEYAYLEALDLTVQRSFRRETYVEAVAGGTMLLSAADLSRVGGWRGVPRSVDRALLQRVLEDGGLVYATHGHGFVYVRHEDGHTWSAETRAFLSRNRDQWTGLQTELLRRPAGLFLGDGRPRKRRWAILNPATRGVYGDKWGDTAFCESLAHELRRLGQDVVVYRRGEFDEQSPRPDVALWIRGLTPAQRVPGAVNAVWVISHPDEVQPEELAGMDLVFAASPGWALRMARETGLSIEPLLQAVDATKFACADTGSPASDDVVFVGAARPQQPRKVVLDAVAAGVDVKIWGPQWSGLVPEELVKGEYLAPEDLPGLYSGAAVVLADHHPDMAREGFIAVRIFEAVASGACVVSDDVEGLNDIFGPRVRTRSSIDDLKVLHDPAARDAIFGDASERGRVAELVSSEHSFTVRARELVARVSEYELRPGSRVVGNATEHSEVNDEERAP